MGLSVQEQMLVEQKVSNQKKSVGIAYLLLLFLGGLGVHRFYLGRTGSGVSILLLSIVGWATLFLGIGLVFLAVVAIWWLVDLFLIPSIAEAGQLRAREAAERSILMQGYRSEPASDGPSIASDRAALLAK